MHIRGFDNYYFGTPKIVILFKYDFMGFIDVDKTDFKIWTTNDNYKDLII